jgi:hypothetical protein
MKLIRIGIILLVLFSQIVLAKEVNQNLLKNPGFEVADGKAADWYLQSFGPEGSGEVTTDKVHGGKYALKITANKENDIRMTQFVKVEPNTDYCLSGWILTDDIRPADRVGANFSVINSADHSEALTGLQGWTRVTYYFRTYEKQEGIIIGPRIGNWGSLVSGTAYFDDLVLQEVKSSCETLPGGVKIEKLTDNRKALYGQRKDKSSQWIYVIGGLILLTGILAGLILRMKKRG